MTEEITRHDSEEGRTYTTPNGELKSVTTFLQLRNKPFLVPWAAKLAAEYFKDKIDEILKGELDIKNIDLDQLVKDAKAHHKKKSDEAKEYGSEVHKYITDFFGFNLLPEDPKMRSLVESGLNKITAELGMTVGYVEKMVYFKKAYAGTLDIIGVGHPAEYLGLKRIIVDIKTGSRGKVYEEALLQIAAYAQAWEWMEPDAPVDLAVILPLNKETGEAGDLIVLDRKKWLKYARVFNALVKYSEELDKCTPKKRAKKK